MDQTIDRNRLAVDLAVTVGIYTAWTLLVIYGNDLPLVLLFFLGGYITCLHGSLQHIAVHGYPTRWKWLNTLLAYPPLAFYFPYLTYRESHLEHHKVEVFNGCRNRPGIPLSVQKTLGQSEQPQQSHLSFQLYSRWTLADWSLCFALPALEKRVPSDSRWRPNLCGDMAASYLCNDCDCITDSVWNHHAALEILAVFCIPGCFVDIIAVLHGAQMVNEC